MQKLYTENDLLKYIYKESSPDETLEIEKAITYNTSLKNLYYELLEGIDLLNKTYFRPSEITLENILRKAKDGLQQNVD